MFQMHKTCFAVALVSTTALAVAQSPAESFADRIKQYQALSSAGPAYHPPPEFSNEPTIPPPHLPVRWYASMSSGALAYRLDGGQIVVWEGPSFAQTHPQGLSTAEYLAYSSDSEVYKLPPGSDAMAFATVDVVPAARQGVQFATDFRSRINAPSRAGGASILEPGRSFGPHSTAHRHRCDVRCAFIRTKVHAAVRCVLQCAQQSTRRASSARPA